MNQKPSMAELIREVREIMTTADAQMSAAGIHARLRGGGSLQDVLTVLDTMVDAGEVEREAFQAQRNIYRRVQGVQPASAPRAKPAAPQAPAAPREPAPAPPAPRAAPKARLAALTQPSGKVTVTDRLLAALRKAPGSARELSDRLGLGNPDLVSAMLGNFKNRGLVDKPAQRGGAWSLRTTPAPVKPQSSAPSAIAAAVEICTYPKCTCPFDAPADPNWCARKLPQAAPVDPVEAFLAEVRAELKRARAKFPGDRLMTIALAEEFGELCKAVLDESASRVRKEAVQTAVMAARVALDGDGSVTDWRQSRKLDPLTKISSGGVS